MTTLKKAKLKIHGLFFYHAQKHPQLCPPPRGLVGLFTKSRRPILKVEGQSTAQSGCEGGGTHPFSKESVLFNSTCSLDKERAENEFKNSKLMEKQHINTSNVNLSSFSGCPASDRTIEKFLDAVFYYQELVVDWVKGVSPRPSSLAVACGATLYLVAICSAIQRQEGDRWFSVFVDSKIPALSEPAQKNLWDSFENVTSQYMTLVKNGRVSGSYSPPSCSGVEGADPLNKELSARTSCSDPITFSAGHGQTEEETHSLCDSSIVSRVDLYKKRVLIRLQSPWDKQSRQQYAGLFYDHHKMEKNLEKSVNLDPVESFPDTPGVLQSVDTILPKNQSLGIKPLYRIDARNDYNPVFFSKNAMGFFTSGKPCTAGKERIFCFQEMKNPLSKTKNWFTLTNKISLWDYFPLKKSKKQVYLESDAIPCKLDSALFSSYFHSNQRPFDFLVEPATDNKVKNVLSPNNSEDSSQLQKSAFIKKSNILFSCYNFGKLNPIDNANIEGRNLVQAHSQTFQKSALAKQCLDSSKLKLWFEKNKELAHGEEFNAFEKKLKFLFYSQGILPIPELDDLGDAVFEDNEQKTDKTFDKILKNDNQSSDSELFCFLENKDDEHYKVKHKPVVFSRDDLQNEQTDKTEPMSLADSPDWGVIGTPKPYQESEGEQGSSFPQGGGEEIEKVLKETIPLETFQSGDHTDFLNNSLPSFCSHFHKNTWISPRLMSGYQFPELNKKEILCLHRRFIIRHLLSSLTPSHLYAPSAACLAYTEGDGTSARNSPVGEPMVGKTAKNGNGGEVGNPCLPFKVFSHKQLASQISLLPMEINLPPNLPAYLFRDMFSPSFFSPLVNQQRLTSDLYKNPKETLNQDDSKVPQLKLTYRVIQLEEEREVAKAFARLGRDYKDYLSYPKDGLEALKVSPSIEDEHKEKDSLAEAKEKDRKSELGKTLKKFAYKKGYAVTKEKETSDLPDINHTDLNHWISSLCGTENMLSDRKSNFLGRQNVLRKRLFSRECQDISTEILSINNPPLPKLKSRARRNEIQLIRPAKLEAKNDVGAHHRALKVNSLLRKKRILATHLVTPFETHNIMPEISKSEWRQMIEYQLREYFFEEDKRLEPLVKKNPHHHFKIQRVNTFLPWVRIRTPKEKPIEWPLTRLDYEKIDSPRHGFGSHNYSANFLNGYLKNTKFQAPPHNFIENVISKRKVTLSSRKSEHSSGSLRGGTSFLFSRGKQSQQMTGERQSWNHSKLRKWADYVLEVTNKLKVTRYNRKKVLSQQLTLEPFTKHSWLLIYRFFLAFAFRDLGKYLYRVTLKDFMINMAHTHFGLAVTSKEFRRWLQYVPPKLFYTPHKRFQDVVGLQEFIPVFSEIIWFLRNSCRGKGIPRGVLLVGPHGTGKTFLVQAIAGEAQVPVVVQSMTALRRTDLGGRPYDRLQEMFEIARKQAPCILFMDEIDAVAESRGNVVINDMGPPDLLFSLVDDIPGRSSYSLQTDLIEETEIEYVTSKLKKMSTYDVYEEKKEIERRRINILLRLLSEMDGAYTLSGVVFLATTNRPAVLDPALLRPGRLEKIIQLKFPGHEKRIDLFKLHTQKLGSVERMPWDYLASRTADMSRADIAAAVNHSAIRAILDGTVHTVETLEQGLNVVAGIPISSLPSPCQPFKFRLPIVGKTEVDQKSSGKKEVSATKRQGAGSAAVPSPSVQGGEVSSKAPLYPQVKFGKKELNSECIKYTGYTVYGTSPQYGDTTELYHRMEFLNKKNFPENMKQAFNTSSVAYYQAGKGVVQSVLPRHAKVGFLAFSPDNNDESPFSKRAWEKLTSSNINYRKVDLEIRIIGMYAGKASEMLHLSVNSFKNYSSYKHPVQNRTWVGQSNLGFPEMLLASSLAHVMIDRWYLYSKRMFSLKTNSLITSINEDEILDDDVFPMFANFCEELEKDALDTGSTRSLDINLYDYEDKMMELAAKEGGLFHIILERIKEEKSVMAWWLDKNYKGGQWTIRPYHRWYRMYTWKPEEKERNEEWLAPEFFYTQPLNLPTFPSTIRSYQKALKALLLSEETRKRGKPIYKLDFFSKRKKIKFAKFGGSALPFVKVNNLAFYNSLQALRSKKKTALDKSQECLSGNTFSKLYSSQILPKRGGLKKESHISLLSLCLKTWNDRYWVERDYSFHNLVTNCFYTAFLLLDENRELLDFFADHLIRFQKLRKHEISRICSLFQIRMSGEHNLNVDHESDKETDKEQTNIDEKQLTFYKSSSPLSPSWWEEKAFKEAFLSSGLTRVAATQPMTTTFNSESINFKQGAKVKDNESKDDFNLYRMTQEKQEDNNTTQFDKNERGEDFDKTQAENTSLMPIKPDSNERGEDFDKTQAENTSLMPIKPDSSLNKQTPDAQEKQKNVQKDRFWILEKGWGRYSRYKKPNFMRFDFIKFH